jgi:hypothetical protein
MDEDEQAIGSAIGAIIAAHARANMAMVAAILSHLVEKQVLSAEDVRELLAGLEDVAQSASQSLPSSDPDRAEVDRLEVNTLRQLISLLRTALLR